VFGTGVAEGCSNVVVGVIRGSEEGSLMEGFLQRFSEPTEWLDLPVGFYVPYRAVDDAPDLGLSSAEGYRETVVPGALVFLATDVARRFEKSFVFTEERSGGFGTIYQVRTVDGPQIGFVVLLNKEKFVNAYMTPDVVHLASVEAGEVPEVLYEDKVFRSFSFGGDVMFTTRARWFRTRNNPKFLGYSKDDKP
jgi:hypothetical protein